MRKLHVVLLGIFIAGVLLGGIGAGVTLVEYSGFEYGGKVYLGEENLVTKELDYNFTPSANERIRLNYCYWGNWQKDTLIVQDESIPVGVIRYRVTYNENLANPSLMHWNVEDVEEQEWNDAWKAARQKADAEGWTIEEAMMQQDNKEYTQAEVLQEMLDEEAQTTISEALLDEEAQTTISEALLDEDTQEKEEYAQATASPEILDEEKERRHEIVIQLESNRFNDGFILFMENKDRILEELKQKKITSYEVARITDVEILVNPQSMLYIDDYTR